MEIQKKKDNYNALEKEAYWQDFWDENGVNDFNPESPKTLFTIDTPPPTISGALHLGHIYSYTQAEIIARYKRLAGFNVRYPIGMDNNGLPTERLVEKERGIKGYRMPLADFVKICTEVTEVYREKYKALWRSLGLSVDWNLEYATISKETQKFVQTVFKELFEKEAIYQKEATALYCCQCQTSVAQAEVEDSDMDSAFLDIVFKIEDGEDLIISTTRPELLPACMAVFVHPEDERYLGKIGKKVTTPLGREVKILADDKVLKEKGTGAVMCCTYGDETDVYWTRTHNLAERIIIGKYGKMIELEEIPEISNKSILEARKIIVAKLNDLGVIKKEEKICHSVGVHERCGTPIELIPTKQWFVKVLDKKDDLIAAGNKINWHPAYMQKRYEEWVSGLKWDWCISRERFFGVPIPASVCDLCGFVFIPESDKFPVDPKINSKQESCPKCKKGILIPENGVLDTWFTSSLTPDLNNDFPGNGKLTGKMYPMTMRPQAHDIIRTWAMYSILMGLYRHQDVPWDNLMISGHILLRKGEKISKKTGGGKYKPEDLISTYSADAIRYTMCGALLGRDAYFDEQEIKTGKRLITKIYNAGKLLITNLKNFPENLEIKENELELIDRWILERSRVVAVEMEIELDRYEFSRARKIFEDFFWGDFCDNYLEIVKGRLWNNEGLSDKKNLSAQYALYYSYLNILKIISPFLPHIAEEMYHAEISSDGEFISDNKSGIFAKREDVKSIHFSTWPSKEANNLLSTQDSEGVKLMLSVIADVRKYKSAEQLSMVAVIPSVIVRGTVEQEILLKPFWDDLIFATKADKFLFQKIGEDFKDDVANTLQINLQ